MWAPCPKWNQWSRWYYQLGEFVDHLRAFYTWLLWARALAFVCNTHCVQTYPVGSIGRWHTVSAHNDSGPRERWTDLSFIDWYSTVLFGDDSTMITLRWHDECPTARPAVSIWQVEKYALWWQIPTRRSDEKHTGIIMEISKGKLSLQEISSNMNPIIGCKRGKHPLPIVAVLNFKVWAEELSRGIEARAKDVCRSEKLG